MLPKQSSEVAHFCTMKITQDVHNFTAAQTLDEAAAIEKGIETMAVEFVRVGAEAYIARYNPLY